MQIIHKFANKYQRISSKDLVFYKTLIYQRYCIEMNTKSGVVLMCVLSSISFNPAVVQKFLINQIVPDVIDIAPKMELSVATY